MMPVYPTYKSPRPVESVAQKIVQSHGGTINLSPAPEQGTICEIKIPLERSDDPADTHGPLPIEPSNL